MKDVAQLEAEKAAKLAEVAAEYDAKIAAASADPLLIEAREIVGSVATGLEKNPLSQGGYDKGQYVRIALAALRRGMELAAAPLMPVTAMTDEHVTTLRTHLDLGTFYKHPNVEAAIRATLARGPVAAWPSDAEIEQAALTACDAAYREVYDADPPSVNTPYLNAFVRDFARHLRAHLTGGAA